MNTLLKNTGICALIFILLVCGLYCFRPITSGTNTEDINFYYLEDYTGQIEFSGIDDAFLQNKFVKNKSSVFSFGRSRSVFWIRIFTKNLDSLKDYIAIYCPNLQNVMLYEPTEHGYTIHYSGWGNSSIRNDEGLTYPAFKWDENCISEKPIYIRIQSCYSYIYTIDFYTQNEFNDARKIDFCLNSLLFGMLLTIIILNSIIYLKFKNKIFILFVSCILLITIHQGCSTGFYNIIMPKHANVLMSLSIEVGLLYIFSIILFFAVFSNVKTYNKTYYKWIKFLMGACLLGYPLCMIDKVSANLYAHLLTVVSPVVILYISLRLYFSGHKKLWYFIMGWFLTILLYILNVLSCEGILHLQNNYITLHVPLMCMVLVSIIFSDAVTEYAKQKQIDHLKIQLKYQTASEQVKRTETALMQTQIKPHFLYNTLTAIERLCEIDSKKAQNAIADFADYLRCNIDFSTETRLISIEKELENVKHYLALEKMRFDDRLTILFNIDAHVFMLPPLVVQPIVENAVRYGVTKKPEGGTVQISVCETETHYQIFITDDGLGFDTTCLHKDERSHIGISNVRNRLINQCCGDLVIDSRIGEGTTVTITIPKESKK